MTGSTGNIYTVHIAQQPSCNCPHAKAGNQCKHWLYVRACSSHLRLNQQPRLDSNIFSRSCLEFSMPSLTSYTSSP